MEYKNAKQHIKAIVKWFGYSMAVKYLKGAKEHGGVLWRKPVTAEISNELMDFVVYYHVLLGQLEEIKQITLDALEPEIVSEKNSDNTDLVWKNSVRRKVALAWIRNILEYGNKEGILEKGT